MSKRIKTTILFFILLIISVIGNTLYTSSNLSESFFIHSEHTSDCQLQAPLPMAEKALRHLSDHSQTDLFYHPHPPVVDHLKTDRLQLFPNALELFRRQGSGKCDHTQFHFQRQNAFFPENVRNGHYTPAAYHILYINCRFHDPYAKIVNVSQVNSFPSRFLVPVSPDSACFKQP